MATDKSVSPQNLTDIKVRANDDGSFTPYVILGSGSTGSNEVSLSTLLAGEDLTNDIQKVEQRVTPLNGTASQLVKTGAGRFWGFIINSHTSGTLKFWDNTSAAATIILNTITFAAGPDKWVLPVAISFSTGLYVTVGGTIDYTILYR